MINKLFFLVFLVTLVCCKNTKTKSTAITLELENVPAQTIYLKHIDGKNQPTTIDSVKYEGKGTILFHANVTEPMYLQILFGNNPSSGKFIPLITEGKSITVKGNYEKLKEVSITGDPASIELMSFLKKINSDRDQINSIGLALDTLKTVKRNDSLKLSLDKKIQDMLLANYQSKLEFARTTKNPILAIVAFQTFGSMEELKNGKPLMDSLKEKFSTSGFFNNSYAAYLSVIGQKNESAQQDAGVSNMAKEISLPDVNGKIVTLSSFKGKFVLIDFWASWCGPCRAENPNLVAAFNKFKNKNFTVLGVSLDKDKDAWLAAIKQDGLAWTQISDLKYWQSQAARDYGINSIPANYLIDPSGKIIASNLTGSSLEAKLAAVLN